MGKLEMCQNGPELGLDPGRPTLGSRVCASSCGIPCEMDIFKPSLDIVCAQSLQSCPTLCDPIVYSPSGSYVHGILQARILEWRLPSPRGSSRPKDRT